MMKKFDGSLVAIASAGTPREINEASLSRLYQNFLSADEKSWAMLTSWRADVGPAENKANLKKLHGQIRSLGHGYVRMDGVWDGEKEPSVWINGISRKHAVKLGQTYRQDAIVYAGPETDGKAQLIVTFDNGQPKDQVVDTFTKFHPQKIAQGYSKLKRQTFALAASQQPGGGTFYFEYVPQTQFEAQALEAIRRDA